MPSRADPHVFRATFLGLFSVLIWGPALPLMRLASDEIGAVGYIAIVFTISAICGIAYNLYRKNPVLTAVVIRNPIFYLRWILFVSYVVGCVWAVNLVSPSNLPLVILLNYLWPTAVIVCSVLVRSIRVTHPAAFILGSLIVIASLTFEVAGPEIFTSHTVFSPDDLLAFVIIFVNAVAWGFYSAISRKYGHETGSGSVIPLFQLTFALGLPVYFMSDALMPWEISPFLFAGIAVLGILFFIAHQSWNYGMQHGNVVVLSLCADFIPWLSLFAAHLFLGSQITTSTIIAAITLVIGAIITRFGTSITSTKDLPEEAV